MVPTTLSDDAGIAEGEGLGTAFEGGLAAGGFEHKSYLGFPTCGSTGSAGTGSFAGSFGIVLSSLLAGGNFGLGLAGKSARSALGYLGFLKL